MKTRIAVPLADGKLCQHFGHCQHFALLEVETTTREIVSRNDLTPPPHEPGVLPRWLAEQGVEVILAGGMGQRAQALLADYNIKVVVGLSPDTPEAVAGGYLGGTLKPGPNVCDH